ncbi:MAG: nickel-dependent hydrogenase large subunit [Halodesulfurarchaeum sp.]
MPEIEIDPTTRIEGHHSTTLEVENGEITKAKSHMDMFRGIEVITLEHPPSDAPQFTQMTCGVCFTCHRQASILAIEDAARRAGVFDGVPRNARLLRDIMEGLFFLWNHAVHLFALAGPDYSDAVANTGFTRLNPAAVTDGAGGEGYKRALEVQRTVLQAFSEFGGRAPHPLTYAPGGTAVDPDASSIQQVRSKIDAVNEWLGPTEAVPEVIENVMNGNVESDFAQGLHDIVSILLAAKREGADAFGTGPNRYYANGVFYGTGDGSLTLPRGVYADGTLRRPTREDIVNSLTEDVEYSWYTNESGGAPATAPPPEPAPEKSGAYSWGKAPRYNGRSMEVGPLARLVSAQADPFDLRADLGGGMAESNTLNRLIARAQEALIVRDKLTEWIDALDPSAPFNAGWSDDFSGEGVGLWEASRGALSHWVQIEDGEVTNYQIITPTLWNLGPRDSNGNPSIFEGAVEGMTVQSVSDPINVMRTIRSFDPCLACSVHVQSPIEEFETVIEPASATPGGNLSR